MSRMASINYYYKERSQHPLILVPVQPRSTIAILINPIILFQGLRRQLSPVLPIIPQHNNRDEQHRHNHRKYQPRVQNANTLAKRKTGLSVPLIKTKKAQGETYA